MLLRYNLEAEGYEVEIGRARRRGRHPAEGAHARSGHARLDAARPVRHRAVPAPAGAAGDAQPADHHAHRARRGKRAGARAWPPAPTTTSSSRSRCRNCWRGCARCCAAPARSGSPPCCPIGDIELDREKKRVSRAGRAIDLGPTEFRLLEFLMERPGRVFSREQLLDGVWGKDIYIDERTVDVHVGRLRKALNRGQRGRSDPHRARRRLRARRPLRPGGVKLPATSDAKPAYPRSRRLIHKHWCTWRHNPAGGRA